jgi:hypothetical protein
LRWLPKVLSVIRKLLNRFGWGVRDGGYTAPGVMTFRPDAFAALQSYGDAMRSVPRREAQLRAAMRSWSPSFAHAAALRRALERRAL